MPHAQAGYRTFTEPDLPRLQFLSLGKAIGVTPEESHDIGNLLSSSTSPCDRRVEAIEYRLCTIDRTIDEPVPCHGLSNEDKHPHG